MSQLIWYTLQNGRLCLGNESDRPSKIFIATDIFLNQTIKTPLRDAHIRQIGGQTELWGLDPIIENKICRLARQIFEAELKRSVPSQEQTKSIDSGLCDLKLKQVVEMLELELENYNKVGFNQIGMWLK